MKFKMKMISLIAGVALLFGCAAWNAGIATRLATTALANEVGIEFADANPKLAEASVAYLEMTSDLAQTPYGYRSAIELGVNELMEIMDEDRRARLQPLMTQLLSELAVEVDLDGVIKIPDEIDSKLLQSLVNGFKSGIEYQLDR